MAKAKKSDRSIETMYRVIYRNQINLSAIADNKANMLLGINAILLSVIITLVGGGTLVTDQIFMDFRVYVPLMILLASTSLAMIYATLAARPNVPKMTSFSDKTSLFFFENLVQLGKEGFDTKMTELRTDMEQIYYHMNEDIYDHGRVLSKKYRRLKFAYNIFMIGFSIAISCFVILRFV